MGEQTDLHREKIQQARNYMAQRNIDCWLIRDRGAGDPSIPLLFGLPKSADALYMITSEHCIAMVPEVEQLTVVHSELFDRIETYRGSGVPAELLSAVIGELKPNRIALNLSKGNILADGLTVGSYNGLLSMLGPEYAQRIVSSEDYVQRLRSIKSAQEIAYIKKAIEITLDIYQEVFASIRIGMSEIEIGQLFVDGMKKRNVVNGNGRTLTPPIVMKERIAHRAPGEARLERGDYLIMDFSVDYMGYCSDIARTAYVLKEGETEASQAMQDAFRTVREASVKAVEALTPGNQGYKVDAAARQYVLDKGYPEIFHAVGHQLGRDVHDGGTILGPLKKSYRQDALSEVEVGMVFAIEPTILFDEGPAIISEDNYHVTENGVELLGEHQKELVLIG